MVPLLAFYQGDATEQLSRAFGSLAPRLVGDVPLLQEGHPASESVASPDCCPSHGRYGHAGGPVGSVEGPASLLEFERVERWPRFEDGLLACGEAGQVVRGEFVQVPGEVAISYGAGEVIRGLSVGAGVGRSLASRGT